MRGCRGPYVWSLWGTAFWVGIAGLSPVVMAGDFYSWIDASGTTVITDDPSRIPPATDRTPVAVHHFKESPPPPRQGDQSARVEQAEQLRSELSELVELLREYRDLTVGDRLRREPSPIHPSDLNLPEVLLDVPGESVKPQYLWVPFVVPVYLGAGVVPGFWCHRDADSPIQAFKRFLAQQPVAANPPNQPGAPQQYGDMVYHPALAPLPALPALSGNPVFDQIMRERHALIERTFARFQSVSPGYQSIAPPRMAGPRPPGGRPGFRR